MNYSPEGLPLYQEIIENYQGSVIVTDAQGVIIFINEMGLRLTKRSREEMIGWSVHEIVRLKVFSNSSLAECIETKKVAITYLYINDDIEDAAMAIAVPVFDTHGKLIYAIAYSQLESFSEKYFATIKQEKKQIMSLMNYLVDVNKGQDYIAESPSMIALFNFARSIGSINATILLNGESGTGKEVLARHIYKYSDRSDQVFIPINCASIPGELMESEFFGYEKGAFTGARSEGKPGLFEMANKGTLLLDEIGELPLSLQSKLLRVLDSGEYKMLGSNQIKKSDVRIIAATNRNLLEMTKKGTFREDLYYRLNVLPLNIPPLRERPEDIVALTKFFLEKYNRKYHLPIQIGWRTMEEFRGYRWPGNVRELANAVERYVITSGDLSISPLNQRDSSQRDMGSLSLPAATSPQELPNYKDYIEATEREYLLQLLEEYQGNVNHISRHMDLHISGVYRKLEKHQLSPTDFKKDDSFPM